MKNSEYKRNIHYLGLDHYKNLKNVLFPTLTPYLQGIHQLHFKPYLTQINLIPGQMD